jgi:hypothetical protein
VAQARRSTHPSQTGLEARRTLVQRTTSLGLRRTQHRLSAACVVGLDAPLCTSRRSAGLGLPNTAPVFRRVRTSCTNHHVLQRRRFAFRTRRLSTEQGPHFEPLCLSAQGSISNPAAPFGTPGPDRWPSTLLAPTDRTSEARTPFGVRGTPHSRRNQHAFGVPLGAESRPIAAFRAVTGEASLCGRRQGRRAGQP